MAIRTRRAIVLLTAWALGIGSTVAQVRPDVKAPAAKDISSILYVGNSFFYYNNGILRFTAGFSHGDPGNQKLSGTMVTISGSGFAWHDLESYFRPNAVGSYTFNKQNQIIFNSRARPFDAVLMMDCSQCPIHPKLRSEFFEYAKRDADIARRHGVEPMLFMSWAYKDRPEMTAQLDAAYTEAGNANHELVVPAGLAFARVRQQRPEIELYQPDLRHPTVAGSYLAGAVVYASIVGKPLDDNSFTAGLDPALAAYLRKSAWEVVSSYYAG